MISNKIFFIFSLCSSSGGFCVWYQDSLQVVHNNHNSSLNYRHHQQFNTNSNNSPAESYYYTEPHHQYNNYRQFHYPHNFQNEERDRSPIIFNNNTCNSQLSIRSSLQLSSQSQQHLEQQQPYRRDRSVNEEEDEDDTGEEEEVGSQSERCHNMDNNNSSNELFYKIGMSW